MKKSLALVAWCCVSWFYGFGAGPMSAQDGQNGATKSTFLVIYRPGPSWIAGKPTSQQPLKEHGQYMLSLSKRGVIKLAGPFSDDAGGAMLLQVASEAEARAIVAQDPGVKSGVFLHEIHPWTPVDGDKLSSK